MDDQKQLFVFAQPLPGNDQSLVERMKTAANSRNRYGAITTYALSETEANNIVQMVVGPSHIAFLFKNGRVARLGYHLTVNKDESGAGAGGGGGSSGTDDKPSSGSGTVGLGAGSNSSGTSAAGSGSATNTSSATSALNRTAKIRRVMLTSRRSATLGERAGVIVDRTRPMVPVSAIPEDLIAQAQVVLQGKSRDVIVRELQRTNLNVNEAVNNLLSRDDEEGDEMDEGSESYLPEELLSLLDAGLRSDVRGTAVIDHDAFYAATGNGFDYVVARDIARRKADRGEKKNDKSKEGTSNGTNAVIKVYDRLQYWNDNDDKLPYGVTKFTKIVSMHSELIALADDGFIYGWSWKSSNGSVTQHPFGKAILANGLNGEKIMDIVTCAYRACILTSANRVASFMDAGACGQCVSKMLMMPLSEVPDGEKAVALYACPMFSLVRTLNNNFYWWGIYPFNERRKLWERVRSRSRRHVTFDVSEITEGCEVRTKSHPIYTAGSVAISFVSGVPMIGTLMESAWTLAELCRFRVQTPSQYDESSAREKHSGDDQQNESGAGQGFSSASCSSHKKSILNQNGKRPREESVTPTFRETAWALNDVIFIHEENSQDTAIVKIVDGAYCGIVYKPSTGRTDANLSKVDCCGGAGASGTTAQHQQQPSQDGESQQQQQPQQQPVVELTKIRLMRKDDLVIVSPTNRTSRSPDNFQMQLTKIQLPNWLSARKLHSVTVDNTGVRMLVEKRGRMHLIRVSVFGKLLTDHLLPMNSIALSGVPQLAPQLINYGDESLTIIRDGNGSVIPMCRDAVGGFREPVYLGLASIRHSAIGLRPIEQSSDAIGFGMTTPANAATGSTRQINRTAIIATLIAPSPTSIHPAIPSLIQTILYCDLKAVEYVLDALRKESVEVIMSEVLYARCDGNRNIIHTALMSAFSSTNRDDEDTDDNIPLDKANTSLSTQQQAHQLEMSAADQTRASYDQRWQRILRRRGNEPSSEQLFLRELMNPIRRSGHEVSSVEDVLADIAKSFEDSKKGPPLFFDDVKDSSMPILATPVSEPKQRQINAIEIVRTLCRHPTTVTYLHDLLTTKDIHGHTPFMCAVNIRAYSAAYFIWMAIENLQKDALTTTTPQSGKKTINADSIINATIFPVGSKPDDSPLFVLCVNDTCSFTWTGDEHINQDIFECKTCGLIGTLCCCTECAYTCHRNHDCKLKRTSPTAYCDCWEKCSCKALVVGNKARREKLLETLLHGTDLINQVNARGEHLMLFLARTVGRQLVEQEHYQRRGSSSKPKPQPSTDGVTPEHDLEPPKFARTAFMKLLTDWRSVKSVIMIGVKKQQKDVLILEEVYQLNQQSGTSHLDKFVFTLLAKCTEAHIDSLLNTLIAESNKKDNDEEKRDPDVDFIIARFIRSVIRLFAILTLLSPVAAGVAAAATSGAVLAPIVSNGAPQRRSLASGFHAVSFSGLLSLVRTSSGRDSSAVKQAKKKSVTNFVLKCRRVFQTLICYSINELCNMADALIAPVRRGILKPTALIQQSNSTVDCLEMIEQYLVGEVDLSSLSTSRLDDFTSGKSASKRRRQSSRRDTDRQIDDDSQNTTANNNSTTASNMGSGGTLSALINVVDSDNSSDYESDDVASTRHPVSQGSSGDIADAVDDDQRSKRYRSGGGDYEDEELLSMSGDEDDDDDDNDEEDEDGDGEGDDDGDDDESMDDSVSTPPERGDDEPTSQDRDENENGTNEDGDGAGDGDSEAVVEYSGDGGSGREDDVGHARDRSRDRDRVDEDEEEDIFNVADDDERYEREEEGEEGDGDGNDERGVDEAADAERQGEEESSEGAFSGSNRGSDDPYAFRVSTRNQRRNASSTSSNNPNRSTSRNSNVTSNIPSNANASLTNNERDNTNADSLTTANGSSRTRGDSGNDAPRHDSATDATARSSRDDGTNDRTRNNDMNEANMDRSAEDDEVGNVTAVREGVSSQDDRDRRGAGDGNDGNGSRSSAMRVLFTTDPDTTTTASSRSRALSRRASMRSARRNATFEDMHIAAPPIPPSERDTSSARTSGVTSGRNNTLPLTWAMRRISSAGGGSSRNRESSSRSRESATDRDRNGDNSDENDHHRRFVNSNSPSNGRNNSNNNNNSSSAASSQQNQQLHDAINGEDDCQSSVNKTSQQLAMSFSIITRLVVDLMPLLVDYREYSKSSYSHIPKMLELNDVIVNALRREIDVRFDATWRWMESVLDRTEAQLRFGNALMWSPAGAVIVNDDRKSSSRKDDVRRRGPSGAPIYSPALRPDYTAARQLPSSGRGESSSKKADEENHQTVVRSDLFGYILALMRSNAAENGDDVPIIEFNALKALAFVADAYLSFVDMIEKVDFTLEQMQHSDDGDQHDVPASSTDPNQHQRQTVDMFEDQPMEECEHITERTSPNAATMQRHFFQRSNSLLYPGITAARNHHAFEHKCSDCLVLAEQPQLLRAGVEKEHMFGLPVEQRSAQDHERCAREHGTEHPAHQGLAAPWSSFKEHMPSQTHTSSAAAATAAISSSESREAATASTTAIPGRPNVIVHSKNISAGETSSTSSSPVVPPKPHRRTSSSAASAAAQPSGARPTGLTQSQSQVYPQPQPPHGFAAIQLESLMSALHERNQSQLHKSLARWKHTLSLMAKAYHKQLLSGCGDESSASILLTEMVGFSIREAQFRKKMEKFKAAQTKDIVFEVERDKHELIAQTIRQLNMHYTRRTASCSNTQNPSTAATSQTQSNTSTSSGGSASAGRESGIVGRGGVRLLSLGSFWNGLSTTQSSAAGASGNADSSSNPPLACHKVKVTFKDEPGEGSGVARSFYSAVADAFLTMQTLPDEHHVLTAFGAPSSSDNAPQSSNRGPWTRSGIRERSAVLLGNLSISGRRRGLRSRYMLSVNSQPYFSTQQPQLNESPSHPDGFELVRHPSGAVDGLAPLTLREPDRETLGERLLARVRAIRPTLCNKITGMLLDLQPHQLITILASEDLLRGHVDEAADMLLAAGLGNNSRSGDTNTSSSTSSGLGLNSEHSADVTNAGVAESLMSKAASTPNLQGMNTTTSPDDDTLPLFYRASKGGYYTPIAGKNTAHRLNAFRNVGRMIGICLMQMEIFPLHVCRHVLKFILGRPINWFDLAFYDPILFESMRTLVFNEGALTRPDQINDLMLNFEVALPIEEGGGVVELIRGGSQIAVTHENVIEYIYRFVEMRLLGKHLKALEAIKQGVYDVIPLGSLANMTSEDLRLLLCGTQEVSMTLMQSYTSFTDESSAAPDVLQRFKGWFWSVCGKLNNQEKQDLVFFWTGSPSLPSSEEGFQPLPTVLVRPADDQHLPTANTCISRLYLPLYSSKKVLRSKLLMAIKAKNFGFV